MNCKTLYKMALSKWGKSNQIDKAIEECAELIKSLATHNMCKNGSTVDNILEEIVDVEIMLGQLKVIFDYHHNLGTDYDSKHSNMIRKEKLKRLERLLNE